MEEKIKAIEAKLMECGSVALAKQHKNEYIIYSFYTDLEKKNITRQTKEHYKDKELNTAGKRDVKEVKISVRWFFDHTVYDLLNRGYELITME